MAAPTVIELGSVTLTRVVYVDAAVPPEVVGLSADEVKAAIAAAFDSCGIPMEAITRVVVSHIEGVAMNAVRRDGGWSPFFPNAQIAVGESALATLTNAPDHWTVDAWRRLIDDGNVGTYADGETLLPGVVVQHTGAHNAGHHVFHFGKGADGAPLASTVGHLAISPLHLVTGPCAAQHPDPELAWQQLCSLAADGRILLGPLWPSPGAGRWIDGQFVAVGGPSS